MVGNTEGSSKLARCMEMENMFLQMVAFMKGNGSKESFVVMESIHAKGILCIMASFIMEKDMERVSSGMKGLNVSSMVNGNMINLPEKERLNAKTVN